MMYFSLVDGIIFLSTLIIIIFAYGWHTNNYFKRRNVKCVEPSLFFGNMFKVFFGTRHSIDLTDQIYNNFPNEKYVGLFNFASPLLVVKDLDLLKQILVKDFDHFVDHMDFTDEQVDPVQGRSLFALQGEKWREMRSTLSPAFTSSKIKAMLPFVTECSMNVLNYLKNEADNPTNKGSEYIEINTKDLTSRYASDVIASCAFGLNIDSYKEKDNTFYTQAKNSITFSTLATLKLFLFFISPRITRLFKIELVDKDITSFFRKLVVNSIDRREKLKIVRPDMIHLLMLAKQGSLHNEIVGKSDDAGDASVNEQEISNKPPKTQWTDDELTAQALLFILAGFDTISTVLSYMFHELAVNTDIQSRLYKEIDDYMKRSNGKFDPKELNNLEYLDMVISETLRLWPPLLISDRKCVKPFNLPPPNGSTNEGYTIQKEDGVWISIYNIQRDPKYFKNPNDFDPERFSDENKPNITPYTYMPFGYGPRICIGSRFALMELKIFSVLILSHFQVVPTPKTVHPVKIKPHFFENAPEAGFWIGLKKRN